MRLLVTGGAGFIGSHVVDGALAAGWQVAVLDDLSSGKREQIPRGVPLFRVDVRHRAGVEAAVREFRPSTLAHFAAQTSVALSMRDPRLDAEINLGGGRNVLAAAKAAGVERLVFASTGGAMYGHVPPGARARPDWTPAPQSPYAANKLAFEGELAAGGVEHTILRPANVYGPRQDARGEAGVVAIFLEKLRRGEALLIHGREREGDEGCVRDYVHVRDLVRATLEALEGRVGGRILHVSTGVGTTTRSLAERLAASLGLSAELKAGPPRPGDVKDSVLEPGGVPGAPTPLALGLRLTAENLPAGLEAPGGRRS